MDAELKEHAARALAAVKELRIDRIPRVVAKRLDLIELEIGWLTGRVIALEAECINLRLVRADLYDIARRTNHSFGYPWTDPRTGVTHEPPDKPKGKADAD